MTHSEAQSSFSTTMTDDEMRILWQRLETEGCKIIRYNPTSRAYSKNLWRIRITNPSWNGLHGADTAVNVYYRQRANGSWATVS